MAGITLYNAPQSTCSQRVRFALHSKNLQFDEKKLDLFSGDQLKPEYLAINPNGVVPTLINDGSTIIDSSVILEYLEDVFGQAVSMRPSEPEKCAVIRAMIRFIDEVPTPAIRIPSYNLAFLPHFQSMTEDEFQALCDSKPLRREFLKKMGRTGFSESEMDEALGRLSRGIERMASWLEESKGPWIAGEELTIADLCIMPVIVRMDDINLSNLWDKFPSIGKWLEEIRTRREFEQTYYFGSLLTEKYPHLSKSANK